jgi:hypothetical protein
MPRPMPEPAPVTIAVFPDMSCIGVSPGPGKGTLNRAANGFPAGRGRAGGAQHPIPSIKRPDYLQSNRQSGARRFAQASFFVIT